MLTEFASDEDLLDRLSACPHELVYLIGSAVTAAPLATEPGMPRVEGVVELIRGEYRRTEEQCRFDAALVAEPDNRYQAAFRFLLKTRGQDVVNEVIRKAVLLSRRPSPRFPSIPKEHHERLYRDLEDDIEGWHLPPAVEALGRVLAVTPPAARPLVLTSNFDPLVEISVRRAGGQAYTAALHGDGSLAGLDGHGCTVVHFHGDWIRTDTLHTPAQLGQERPKLAASLARLVSARTVVVLGYGGRDNVFTRTLIEMIRGGLAPIKIAWALHAGDDTVITRNSERLLRALQPGIELGRVVLYKGIDVHSLLPRLAARLASPRRGAAAPAGDTTNETLFINLEGLEEDWKRRVLAGLPAGHILDEIGRIKHEIRRGTLAQTGDILGSRFELREPLGEGGFAAVFKAWDRQERNVVAVKILHPRLLHNKTRVERFARGAKVMKLLAERGAAVPYVHTLGNVDDGQQFYAMEYLGGGTLHESIVAGRLTRDQIVECIQAVGDTLRLAHAENIFHRDVKPHNIMRSTNGRWCIIDFDLVRAPGTSGGTGASALGTFMYAAPEAWQSPEEADARSDVFSLAMTALFAFYGRDLPLQAWRDSRAFICESLELPHEKAEALCDALRWEASERTPTIARFCAALKDAPVRAGARRREPRRKQPCPYIGIDFGTTQSIAAVYWADKAVLIPDPDGAIAIPSVVAFPPGSPPIVGRSALAFSAIDPARVVFDLKRRLGSTWSVNFDGKAYGCVQLIALVLRRLRELAEDFIDRPVEGVVLGYPAYLHGGQKQQLLEAAALAGLEVRRFVAEPTAAALAVLPEVDTKEQTVAVYDLGGGTFDVSILEIASKVHEVISVCGDVNLGGLDFDERLLQHAVRQFQEKTGISGSRGDLLRLRQAVEQGKIVLSCLERTTIRVPAFISEEGRSHDLSVEITRAGFRDLVDDLVQRTLECCRHCVRMWRRDADPAQIDRLLLVGLSTQIPFLREAVEGFFDRRAERVVSPDHAVALGLALQAAIIAGDHENTVLVDVLPRGLGIMTSSGPNLMIPPNTTIPTKKSEVFDAPAGTVRCMFYVEGSDTPRCMGVLDLRVTEVDPDFHDEFLVTLDIDANLSIHATVERLVDRAVLGRIELRDCGEASPPDGLLLPIVQADLG